MSGIARILLDRGGLVSGSDAKESRGVVALRARGASIRIGHDESSLDLLPGGPTAVVTTHAAIPKTIVGGFSYSGQVCISVQRIYVERSRYAEFRDKYVAAANQFQFGRRSNDAVTTA